MTTDYKTVFQLAQDKGYKLFSNESFYPAIMVLEDLPEKKNALERTVYFELCNIQKWLRDEHKLCVSVSPSYESIGFMFEIAKFKTYWYVSDDSFEFIESYESALLAGICEALKLI